MAPDPCICEHEQAEHSEEGDWPCEVEGCECLGFIANEGG